MDPSKTAAKYGKVKKRPATGLSSDGSSSGTALTGEGPGKSPSQSEKPTSKSKTSPKIGKGSTTFFKPAETTFQVAPTTFNLIKPGKLASLIAKFETIEPHAPSDMPVDVEEKPTDPDIFGYSKHLKLPYCLKGLSPCECSPQCKIPSPEVYKRPCKTQLPQRSLSNSPPLRRRVSDVRELFESFSRRTETTSAPASITSDDPLENIADIMHDLVELTEPYAAVTERGIESSSCASQFSPSKHSVATKKSKDSTAVKPFTSEDPESVLSLADLYKKANLPFEASTASSSGDELAPPKFLVSVEEYKKPTVKISRLSDKRDQLDDFSALEEDNQPSIQISSLPAKSDELDSYSPVEEEVKPISKISRLPSPAEIELLSTWEFEETEPASSLHSTSVNYLDLSSYASSEPKHIVPQVPQVPQSSKDSLTTYRTQGAIPKTILKSKAPFSKPKLGSDQPLASHSFNLESIQKALKEIHADQYISQAKTTSVGKPADKDSSGSTPIIKPVKPLSGSSSESQIEIALRYYPGLPDYTQWAADSSSIPTPTCDVTDPKFSFPPTSPEKSGDVQKSVKDCPKRKRTRRIQTRPAAIDADSDARRAVFGPPEEVYEESASAEQEPKIPSVDLHDFNLGQGGGADSPDLEFIYDDADTHGNEIAELYSYTEQPELQLNVKAFEDQMEIYHLLPNWKRLSVETRKSVMMKLLDQLESSVKPLRMRSARCLLYLAQGCWAEVQSDTEQQHWTRINSMMLFRLGAFALFTELLNIEIDNSTAAHVAMRKIAVSLADSQDLRVILSVLYIITEVIRVEKLSGDPQYTQDIEAFVFEIERDGEDHLIIKLLSMVTKFCSGAAPHFPMKKVLLLLWKLTLVSLGGMNELKEMKAEKRRLFNLPPQDEDTLEIIKTMRSSSPPASATDLLEVQNQKRSTRPFRRSLIKQSSLDDQESLGLEVETSMANENGDELAEMSTYDERRPTDNNETNQMFNNHILNMYNMQVSPPPQHDVIPRGLPWKPKVRQKDIDVFLDSARQKFLGYSLPGDRTTLFGLPEPIHEGVRVLNAHVYTSLVELQIEKEEEIARNPVSSEEEYIENTPAEVLYQAMLPSLPQYMIALLKILLAAAPTSKAKTDSINIMADVLPEEMPMTVLQSMKLGIDVNRHKEIIVKAVSAILLLFLKHFKLNHIYQFEFMSQHLVFANCIPLVLKFFNQNIMGYVGAKNAIPILDFPSCVIGDQPDLTAESLEIGDAAQFSWRNMFSCINLLRILNKLTKWKHSRIMMVVVFKSAPILKRTLKVRHAMTQLYVLKLLKMQTKYLGRQWRKSNMKTISAIYQKVRHRLNDDWAYGNDIDARPWDFQSEECALRASVDRFNNRRYTQVKKSEFEPVDNNPNSILGQEYDLSDSFKRCYNLWLEQEVHGTPIDWEKLLFEDDKRDKKDE